MKQRALLCIILCFILSACSKQTQKESLDSFFHSIETSYIFESYDKIEYGKREDGSYETLPFMSEEEYHNQNQTLEQLSEKLNKLQGEGSNQLHLDVIKEYIKMSHEDGKYYYENISYLSLMANLPNLLSQIPFQNVYDVTSYFELLKSIPTVFPKYIALEEERSIRGIYPSVAQLDALLKTCDEMMNQHTYFDDVQSKINTFSILDQIIFLKMQEEIMPQIIKAYQEVKEIFATWKTSNAVKEVAYQQMHIPHLIGTNESSEEMLNYIGNKHKESKGALESFIMEHPEVYEEFLKHNYVLDTHEDSKEALVYLYECSKNDFPSFDMSDVEIKEGYSILGHDTNGAYARDRAYQSLNPKIIYLKEKYLPSSYLLLAHEGYPGHMYQDISMLYHEMPNIRYMMHFDGYVEGWAQYAQIYALKYTTLDDNMKAMIRLYQEYQFAFLSHVDLFVNTKENTTKQQIEEIQSWSSQFTKQDAQSFINQVIDQPGMVSMYYYSYFKILDLKDLYLNTHPNKSDYDFHAFFMEIGPAPFYFIEELSKKI